MSVMHFMFTDESPEQIRDVIESYQNGSPSPIKDAKRL